MKNIINYLFFVILVSCLFVYKVNAECSYQERKDLLNETKAVDSNFSVEKRTVKINGINPNTEEEETIEQEQYYFNLNVTNLSENIFIKLTNSLNDEEKIINKSDLTDGIYTLEVDNLTDIVTYYLTFYSKNEKCYAEKINTVQLKKPKQNPVSFFAVCSNEKVSDSKYCEKFITKDFNMNVYDIVKNLNNEIQEKNEKNEKENNRKSFTDILKKYWYLFLIVFLILITAIIIIFYRKRKNAL